MNRINVISEEDETEPNSLLAARAAGLAAGGGRQTQPARIPHRSGAFIFMAGRFYATSAANINDISKSTRLWLPITLDPANQTMRVKWWDAWGLSTFDLKNQ